MMIDPASPLDQSEQVNVKVKKERPVLEWVALALLGLFVCAGLAFIRTPERVPTNQDRLSNIEATLQAGSTDSNIPATASPSSTTVIASTSAIQDSLLCEAITLSVPTPAPAVLTRVASGAPQHEMAPPYSDIRRTIQCIMTTRNTPWVVDIEYPKELTDYYYYLKDKRVQGWQGWVDYYVPEDEPMFGLSIYMEIPNEEKVYGRDPLSDVILERITLEQRVQLMRWQQAQSGVRWYKVSFSGRISAIYSGQIFIRDASISPIEP